MARDYAAGHRSPFSGEIVGNTDEWTEWDYALIYAVQTIEDFTDQYGLLPWEMEDDLIVVDAIRKQHPFKQSIDEKTAGTPKHAYKPLPGEYFVPRVKTRRTDGHIQTFTEWVNKPRED